MRAEEWNEIPEHSPDQNSKVTRVEVIDHYHNVGRAYVFPPKADVEVELSYQDDGRTLKILISKKK